MSHHRQLLAVLALTAAAACGGGGTGPTGGNNGGNNGGNTGGGSVGAVIVGNNFFQSSHNGATPAIDTIPVNTAVTWTWTNTGAVSHGIHSLGTPGFPSGPTQAGNGKTTVITFTEPGTYEYDCTVHGTSMSGTIVVQ